jgi:hypothetical protein
MLKVHKSITIDRVMEAIETDDNLGFCIYCGEEADCVEPDAESYVCEGCEKPGVYGAEQLLFYMA